MKLTYSILLGTVTFEWTPEEQRMMTDELMEGTARTFARLTHAVRGIGRHQAEKQGFGAKEGFGDDHIENVTENAPTHVRADEGGA